MYHFAVASYPGLWGREKIGPGIHCLCMCQIFTEFCENRILSLWPGLVCNRMGVVCQYLHLEAPEATHTRCC